MFDANTIIAAALTPGGVPRRAIAIVRSRGIIALSPQVYGEVSTVLARPKFASVLTEYRRHEILELLSAAALWIVPTRVVRDCRDAKDDCYLELALAAGATAIVSGDEDLLVLDPWRGIPVLRPAEFLARFGD